MSFLKELKTRNALLYWFGLFNLIVAIICLVLMQTDNAELLGVNRWLKPFKFYASVGIMILTMGWLLHYLDNPVKIKRLSIMLVISMFFENGLIILQAIRGTTSHFNNTSTINTIIFDLMGVFILIFTITCIRICILFFRKKEFTIPMHYAWGIRLGILFFVIFSLEGGLMLSLMRHTVGAPDGGPGLPLINWSKEHGDLRIAHFLGIHSLQILPFFGFFVCKKSNQTILFGIAWFILVSFLLALALYDVPLFN